MVEILAKVFCGLFCTMALLFIVFALFCPSYVFLSDLEKDKEKKKKEQKKITIQIIILTSILAISGVAAVVLTILSV